MEAENIKSKPAPESGKLSLIAWDATQ